MQSCAGTRTAPPETGRPSWRTPLTKSLAESDRDRVADHLLRLSAGDRRLRFGVAAGDDTVRDYVAQIDFDRDGLFGLFTDDLSLGGAVHVAMCGNVAELGVSVLAEHRHRGIGAALFARGCAFARNHYVRTLFMHCLTENSAMQHIARAAGMKIVTGAGEVDAYLELPRVDMATVASEFVQERLAQLDYSLKAQALVSKRVSEALAGIVSADSRRAARLAERLAQATVRKAMTGATVHRVSAAKDA